LATASQASFLTLGTLPDADGHLLSVLHTSRGIPKISSHILLQKETDLEGPIDILNVDREKAVLLLMEEDRTKKELGVVMDLCQTKLSDMYFGKRRSLDVLEPKYFPGASTSVLPFFRPNDCCRRHDQHTDPFRRTALLHTGGWITDPFG
jgi:hypothetical protein